VAPILIKIGFYQNFVFLIDVQWKQVK